jgi:hypothetical protein
MIGMLSKQFGDSLVELVISSGDGPQLDLPRFFRDLEFLLLDFGLHASKSSTAAIFRRA